jgi:TPR repeat protein
MKAARKNNAVGQNRLALMYSSGRGIKADPVEAARWHLIAKAGGNNDQFLDDFVRKMKPADRAAAEDKAKPWIARMKAIGPTPFPDPPKQ